MVGPPVAVSQLELVLEVEVGPEAAAEGGVEDDREFLVHGLWDEMLDVCAGWEEANLGSLVDFVACVTETRQVVIREVEITGAIIME